MTSKSQQHTQLVHTCLKLLKADPTVLAFKHNPKAPRMKNVIEPGIPDIIGMYKGGFFFGWEIKIPPDRLSLAQQGYKERIETLGGLWAKIESYEDACATLAEQKRLTRLYAQGSNR